MRVLLIEDEVKTARELSQILLGSGKNISIVGVLPSVSAALAWFPNNPAPDLIFSDIQLADGLSFEIFRKTGIHQPVIFCTAFDEYAIQAFEVNGIDYLLKPIDDYKVYQSLEKYERLKQVFTSSAQQQKNLEALFRGLEKNHKKTLLVHYRQQILPVRTNEICFIHYDNGIIKIYTGTDRAYEINSTMEELEQTLDPQDFFRANRQLIIHRNSVLKAEQYFGRKLIIQLNIKTPESVVISKARASAFLKWLEQH